MVNIFDRDYVNLCSHLTIPERVIWPYSFGNVFVWNRQKVEFRHFLHIIKVFIVYKANRHEIGRIICFEKCKKLVAKIPISIFRDFKTVSCASGKMAECMI